MKDLLFVVGMMLLVVVLLAVTPLAFLWSVNSLFGTGIPYNLHSFLAAWILLTVIRIVTRTEVKNEALRRRY
jgi:hypothetical protein